MSHTSRHFQMLGALHSHLNVTAGQSCATREMLVPHGNVHRSYLRALTGPILAAINQSRKKLLQGANINTKTVGILNFNTKKGAGTMQVVGRATRPVSPYKVGDVYRPKRANQHSRNIIVTACTSSHVSYSRGGAETTVAIVAFDALIGRKVS